MNLTFNSSKRLLIYKLKHRDIKGFWIQLKYFISVIKQQILIQFQARKYRFKIEEDILIQRNTFNNFEKYSKLMEKNY